MNLGEMQRSGPDVGPVPGLGQFYKVRKFLSEESFTLDQIRTQSPGIRTEGVGSLHPQKLVRGGTRPVGVGM